MAQPGGSELFEQYERDYTAVSTAVSRRIHSQIPNFSGEQKKEAIRAAEREIEEGDEILEQMEMELRMLPQTTRTKLQPRIKNFKADLTRLKKDLKAVSSSSTSQRDELLAGGSDFDGTSADQRARLLHANARLEDSSRRLEDSTRLAYETEALGADILNQLGGQRETIVSARKKLDNVDENIQNSDTILRAMGRRIQTNKMITALIIVVLLGIIGLIIYLALAG